MAQSTAEPGSPVGRGGRTFRLVGVYGAGAVAGAAAWWINMPLPWMLGPFFLFAILSVTGRRFVQLPMGRELSQVVIGLAIGLRFTPPVVAAMTTLLPEMVMASVYLLCVTMGAAVIFRWLAGVDPVTAFFATSAGGVADMSDVARQFGGIASSVAVVHAIRVSMVVAAAPFIVIGAAGRPASSTLGPSGSLDAAPLLILGLLAAYGMARLLRFTPLPNPWLIGPILAGMALALAGVSGIAVPWWMVVVAQVVLGVWLGCQFRRDLLTALPRVTAAALAIAAFLIGMAAIGGAVLSAMAAIPFSTAFLALAPAAVTEMVLVAKVLNLDAEIVAAFHVMRIVIVSTTVLWVFRLYCLLGRLRLGS